MRRRFSRALVFLITGTFLLSACDWPQPLSRKGSEWPVYRGGPDANQFSSLKQITPSNVDQLKVAWTYHTGDASKRSSIQCNPLMVGGVLFGTTPGGNAFALNATNGEEIWNFDPNSMGKVSTIQGGVNRGVTHWKSPAGARIYHSAGFRLFSLHAESGEPDMSFGKGGFIDMRENLGLPKDEVAITLTTPGIVHNGLLIIGSSLTETYGASPGHIRAYDAVNGELAWIFHTIPQEGEPGFETWSRSGKFAYGGTNAWGGLSLDTKRGWVFAGIGSPTYDFFGAGRKGKNLYGNCILALNAETGELVWHFQTVHHDLWDYDLPCAPNLIELERDGNKIDAIAQVSKMGHVFVLDRETGIPFFPIEERKVPGSDLPGEAAWPTQPVPVRPPSFTRLGISRNDLNDLTKAWHKEALAAYDSLRGGPQYTPPSREGTIMMPGTRGGAEWSGAAFDGSSSTLFVNANEYPSILEMRPMAANDATPGMAVAAKGAHVYQMNCASCHGLGLQGAPPAIPTLQNIGERFSDPEDIMNVVKMGQGTMPAFTQLDPEDLNALEGFLLDEKAGQKLKEVSPGEEGDFVVNGYRRFLLKSGYPAIKPPWGTLNAIDLQEGYIRWQVPLGEFEELSQIGIPPTGTQNLGGPMATASGLVFIGASMDEKFRAFDATSGKILWETRLPAGGYATPTSYSIKGKQYIVVAAGGGGKLGTPSGDSYIAFSLPE